MFVAPLVLVLIATLAFWRRQVWKFRARRARSLEKAQHDRLNSLAHETANALNAIRANLTGFREANSQAYAAEHGKQVEQALARIKAALAKGIGEARPAQAPGSKAAAGAAKSKAA